MKLYRSRDLPGRWIGEDKHGGLVHWPAERGGWAQRTPYTGSKRQLEDCEPALARGTGWPGGGRGPAPRAASGQPSKSITIRATDDERAAWTLAAGDKNLTAWARDSLNELAARTNRSKGKP